MKKLKKLLGLTGLFAVSYLVWWAVGAVPNQILAGLARWVISVAIVATLCELWWRAWE